MRHESICHFKANDNNVKRWPNKEDIGSGGENDDDRDYDDDDDDEDEE